MKKEVNIFQKIISSVIVVLGIILILFINNHVTGRVIESNQNIQVSHTEIIIIILASLMIIVGIWIGIQKHAFNSIIPLQ